MLLGDDTTMPRICLMKKIWNAELAGLSVKAGQRQTGASDSHYTLEWRRL